MNATTMRRLGLLVALLAMLAACGPRDRPISGAQNLEGFKQQLKSRSDIEAKLLTEDQRAGSQSSRSIAIIGDGVAGAAAAMNLGNKIRVYGGPSFWNNLQGLPEIWQTDLAQFTKAGLADPKDFDSGAAGGRFMKDAITAVSLKAFVDADAAYLQTGPVTIVPTANGAWKIVDTEGHVEIVTEALVVGTGLLRSRRITDTIPGLAKVRRDLFIAKRIMTGDEYLAIAHPDSSPKIIGILGAGGNSADSTIHAIADAGVDKVVVWGEVPSFLKQTKAYEDMVRDYGKKICRVKDNFRSISFMNNAIAVNGSSTISCIQEKNQEMENVSGIDLLIESLGRYEEDPPHIVTAAASNRTITYHPVVMNSKLIAIRVSFDDINSVATSKPMYLIGAATSWIPPGVRMSENDMETYLNARVSTVTAVTPAAGPENGPPSFAVAAFMGSQLARECFKDGLLAEKPNCQ